MCVNTSLSVTWFLAGGGFRGAGGGGRRRGQSLSAAPHPASHDLPLEDAGVLAANGEQVGVAVGEADVGDVAAVSLIPVARCLGRGGGEGRKEGDSL